MSWTVGVVVALGVQVGSAVGSIDGRVLDRDGAVMPGVTVEVSTITPGAGGTVTVSTNDRGQFLLPGMRPGTYDVVLTRPSFRSFRGRLTVAAGQRSAASFYMDVGAREEVVNVRPTTGAIQPAPPAPAGPTTPIRVGGSVREPRRLTTVEPVYPDAASIAGIQGTVLIEAVIGRDGRVDRARVLQGVTGLDAAALAAVRQWTYSPTMLNGVPIEITMNVQINFSAR